MMRPGLPMSTIPQMNLPRHQSFGKPEVIAPPVLNKPPVSYFSLLLLPFSVS